MRISTAQFQQRAVETMLEQQARLSRTQQQVASGKRILSPADDPSAASRALGLEREISATRQYQANADFAEGRLGMEEGVLASVTGLLQRTSELVVQGNNDTYTTAERHAIAGELRQRLDELLGLANTRDASGEYLFAGHQGNTRPFGHDGSGTFTYSGDQGQRSLHLGTDVRVPVTDSGAEVFQLIRSGNGTFTTQPHPANSGTGVISAGSVTGDFAPDTYTLEFLQLAPTDPVTYEVRDSANNLIASGDHVSDAAIRFNGAEVSVTGRPEHGDRFAIAPSAHQDVFTTIYQLTEAFAGSEDDPVSRAELHNAVNRGLAELDLALQNVIDVRAGLGSRLNLVESQRQYNEAFLLSAQETLSKLQDLDYAEAISRLQQQMTGLQAAQQAYLQIQNLSLFNYLR